MAKIINLEAKEILDSRGTPTLETICALEGGAVASASVPSGASTGVHEAHELRDGDISAHSGKGVQKALQNVNGEIFDFLKGKDFDQKGLDDALIALDGTMDKSRLGGNAILSVSLAFARVSAKDKNLELYEYINEICTKDEKYMLPLPALNIINGGKHADSGIAFQEFMIIPVFESTFNEKIKAADEVIKTLHELLLDEGLEIKLGDEGGFAPKLASNKEALDMLVKAIEKAGYDTEKIKLGIDVASSTFFEGDKYKLEGKTLGVDEMIHMYEDLLAKYPIISIEDPFDEEDFASFAKLREKVNADINIVGDDLVVTNKSRLQKAIDDKSINTVLIKPNQIGTLSETLETIALAKANGIKTFISHRSGETLDTFVADLAVGTGAPFIKAGSLTRPERIAKYQRLIEIEKQLTE